MRLTNSKEAMSSDKRYAGMGGQWRRRANWQPTASQQQQHQQQQQSCSVSAGCDAVDNDPSFHQLPAGILRLQPNQVQNS